MYDIAIVGAGPAGMTAALYALRAGKSVLILEKNGFGGQITYSPKVENYPGTAQMSGNEFADRLFDQILNLGAQAELETVVSVRDGEVKTVLTEEGGEYEARCVILAPGVRHRMLGLEGENQLVGEGISFCAVCDGAFYKGRTVAVVGGGNSALQEAILLSETSKKVIIVQDMDFLTGEKKLAEILEARPNVEIMTGMAVTGLLGGEALTGIRVQKRATGVETELPLDGLFIAVGLIPENDAFKELAALNDRGYFDSAEDCLTQTPGVFVAGDCRSKRIRQLTTAAADGAVAALAACAYIDGR